MTYPAGESLPRTVDPAEVIVLGAATFPAETAQVREARQWVVKHAGYAAFRLTPDTQDALRQCTSELAANAIRYGGGDCFAVIVVERSYGAVRVEVIDAGKNMRSLPHIPALSLLNPPTCGRGLQVVKDFSTAWHFKSDQYGPGRVVWFEISVGRGRRCCGTPVPLE